MTEIIENGNLRVPGVKWVDAFG